MSKRKRHSRSESQAFTVPESLDKPIPNVYPEIDTDLARDNLENDIPECDLPE